MQRMRGKRGKVEGRQSEEQERKRRMGIRGNTGEGREEGG